MEVYETYNAPVFHSKAREEILIVAAEMVKNPLTASSTKYHMGLS